MKCACCSKRDASPQLDLCDLCIDLGCNDRGALCGPFEGTSQNLTRPKPVLLMLRPHEYRIVRDEVRQGVRPSVAIPASRPGIGRRIEHAIRNARVGPRLRHAMHQVASFAEAVTSGWVDAETYAERRGQCFGVEGERPRCRNLKIVEDRAYCAGCGCGSHKLAQLDGWPLPKLRWRRLTCPLKRPGFYSSDAAPVAPRRNGE